MTMSFRFTLECPKELRSTLEAMTEELVEWRLAAYSKSHRLVSTNESLQGFEAKVSHTKGRAILFLPDTTRAPDRPTGLVQVKLPDGQLWEFKFVKVACNVAKPIGTSENQLSQLLRSWFGEHAGLPGTDYRVIFEHDGTQWQASPRTSPLQLKTIVTYHLMCSYRTSDRTIHSTTLAIPLIRSRI